MSNVMNRRLSGVRVLLVEDSASVREAVRMLLETEGADVAEASTGGEAVGLASAQAFDVVLTDLGLPDLSGEAVVASIRAATRRRVAIVVLSAADEYELARALRVGAERVFRKPFDGEVLVRYLARKGRLADEPRRIDGAREAPLGRR